MDQAFSTATNVVNAALLQKYGDQRPRIDFSQYQDDALKTVPAGASPGDQSRAIIRYLVGLIEKQQKPATEESIAPASTTRLSDLPGPSTTTVVPNLQPEYIPHTVPSTTEPSFVSCSALTGSTLHAELPVGMASFTGVFLPLENSTLQQPSYWPVMIGSMEKGTDLTTNSVLLIHESETKAGHYYRVAKPITIGPTKAGNQGMKLWIKGCDNKELSFGVDASVGARVTASEIASQRRMHLLTIGGGGGTDTPGGVDVLDDSGNSVGKTLVLYKGQSEMYSSSDESGGEKVLAIELTGAGSTPVSVCISGGSPCIIFA